MTAEDDEITNISKAISWIIKNWKWLSFVVVFIGGGAFSFYASLKRMDRIEKNYSKDSVCAICYYRKLDSLTDAFSNYKWKVKHKFFQDSMLIDQLKHRRK